MTWLQLFDKLRRQPLRQTRLENVKLRNDDGTFEELILRFNKAGTCFWFEKEKVV